MNEFEIPQGLALTHLRETFAEIDAAENLLRPQPSMSRRLAASALYAAAKHGDDDVSPALAVNRNARRFHSRALADTAMFSVLEARAASSGGPAARHGEGCHIRFERSRAEPNQFFVVVEMAKERLGQRVPTSLVVCDSDQMCSRFPLPIVRNGVAQIIAEADSELVRLVGDPTTRVYLR